MKVFITSAARKVWLIQAFKNALGECKGSRVIAGDVNPYSAALYFADEYVILRRDDDPSYEEWLFDYCRSNSIDLIIPTRDEELPLFARFAGRFLNNGIRIMVNDEEVINICQDKKRFIDYCANHGFHTPHTYEKPGQIGVEEFPLFLRERFGKGSKGTCLVANQSELNIALNRMKDPIVQTAVDATEYSIDVLSDFDGNVLSAIPRERRVVVSGESYVSITRRDWTIIDDAARLSKDLGLIGHNTIQCFSKNGRNEFIEINPRFGGAASLGFAAGCNSPRLIVDMVNGKKIKPFLGEFKENYVMLRYVQDFFIPENTMECSLNDKSSHL